MNGRCLCGGVTFVARGEIGPPAACHCAQCRKQSGHYWASAWVPDDKLAIEGEVRWYEATPGVKRGFCPTCGSFLFWKHPDDAFTCFSGGSVDGDLPPLTKHIHTGSKGDYYVISDGLPQRED